MGDQIGSLHLSVATGGDAVVIDAITLEQAVSQADDPLGVRGNVVFVRDQDDGAAGVVQNDE